ncbi:MAG: hypothetical protein K2N38_01220 [Oscillospiraceae bacterium]|nr:hypothetical protein [Oscillospiraceae bacterium]
MEKNVSMENPITVDDEKGRCVYSAAIARALIHKDHKVIDIKPNRADPVRTVVVFREDDTFNADLEAALTEYGEKKEKRNEQRRLNEKAREVLL